MNFKQFRLLALFVTIAAATQTIAQSLPELNSPQSINAEAQQITSSLNAGGQNLNDQVLNLGQSINRFGYGPLRVFLTQSGEAVESKLDPFVGALEEGASKGSAVANGVKSAISEKAEMFSSVVMNGFSTFYSEAQSAFASTPIGQNAFIAQSAQAIATQLGAGTLAGQSAFAGSDGSATTNQALQKAAKKYVSKMRSSSQFDDTGATANGISYLLTTVLYALSSVDENNPLGALPVHRRQLEGSRSGSGSGSDLFGPLSSVGPLSGFEQEVEQQLQNQDIVGLKDVVPNVSTQKRQSLPDFGGFLNGGSDSLDSDDSGTSISDSGFSSDANDDNVGNSSPEASTNANDDVNAKGPGGLATVPADDVSVLADDGKGNSISVKRRMHYRRRALIN